MIPQDPVMLLSFVNMKLRDVYPNLHALCDDLDADEREICEKLAQMGYPNPPEQNSFLKKRARHKPRSLSFN